VDDVALDVGKVARPAHDVEWTDPCISWNVAHEGDVALATVEVGDDASAVPHCSTTLLFKVVAELSAPVGIDTGDPGAMFSLVSDRRFEVCGGRYFPTVHELDTVPVVGVVEGHGGAIGLGDLISDLNPKVLHHTWFPAKLLIFTIRAISTKLARVNVGDEAGGRREKKEGMELHGYVDERSEVGCGLFM